MGWPSHPIAICTTCGAPIEDPRFINERYRRQIVSYRPQRARRTCSRGRARVKITDAIDLNARKPNQECREIEKAVQLNQG
jgi:hypothetical protein